MALRLADQRRADADVSIARAARVTELLADISDEFIRNLLREYVDQLIRSADRSLRSAERWINFYRESREDDQSSAESHQHAGIRPANESAIVKVLKRVRVGADEKQESSEEQGGGDRKRRKVIGASEKQSCAVCLEEFEEGLELASMPCSHLFHDKCITTWLQRRPSCPLCRREVIVLD